MAIKVSAARNSRKQSRPVFTSLRKPMAPPGHPMSHAKPDEKARPAGRKAKHKRKPQPNDEVEEV